MHDPLYTAPGTLSELWETTVAAHAGRPFVGTRLPSGAFAWATYGAIARRVDDLRGGLAALGVGEGDAVGIIADNRVEWAIGAFATFGLGARWVPMYGSELPATWKHILREADVRVLLVATAALGEQIEGWRGELPRLERVAVLDATGDGSLAALERLGHTSPAPVRHAAPDAIASVIYTSGTTGDPKGVMLSHANLLTSVQAGRRLYPSLSPAARALNILPWAHVYAQTGELYCFASLGASIGISGGPPTLPADFLAVRPTFLLAVPRVFTRLHDAIWRQVREEGGLKLRLFEAAIRAARRRRETGAGRLQAALLDALVGAKVRGRLGGRLEGALTASARMDPAIAEFFLDLGLPVYDCYGATETSPAVAMNAPGASKLGTVGRPVERVRVEIDRSSSAIEDGSADGEIVVHGPNVMLGYLKKPEATAAVMTVAGGYRTGDRGHLDADGYLVVTGRIKEQYKLENGKYVFPAELEAHLQRVVYCKNALVHGEGRPYNVAIVTLDLEALDRQARQLGLTITARELLERTTELGRAAHDVISLDLMNHLKGAFQPYEIPRRFLLTDEDFTVENGLLTPTLKVKRRAVMERHGERLLALYDEPGPVRAAR